MVFEKKRRYHNLDAMRGLAAICVIAGHFRDYFSPSAHLAVDFFFVLSGFVIAGRYERELKEGIGFVPFLLLRLNRLWPIYFVGILVGLFQILLLTVIGERTQTILDLILSLISNTIFLPSPTYFFQDQAMQGLFPINGPAWSMFFELFVNMVFALCLFRLSTLVLTILAFVFAAWLVWAGFHYGTLNIGWEWPSAAGGFPRVLFSFTMGILLSRFLGSQPVWKHSYAAPGLGLSLMLLLLVNANGEGRVLFDLAFSIILAPAIVALGIFIEFPRQLVPAARFLGYISYPLYILHRGPLGIFKIFAGKMGVPSSVAFAAFLVLIVASAYVVAKTVDYLWIEKRKTSKRPSEISAAP